MKDKRKQLITRALYTILVFIIGSYLYLVQENESELIQDTVEVHYIDVGQGDSILIKHSGGNMLIDAGEAKTYDYLEGYLEKQGIKEFEYIISTHPHSDHIGGLANIINNFDIKAVMAPKVLHTSKTFENFIDAVSDKNLNITTPVSGETFNISDIKFTILAPNSEHYDEMNNYSIMLKMEYGETAFIFTGDAETFSENEVLEKGYDISADVLKVGHHGSRTSTSKKFLEKVNPKYAIISCGLNNSYGHPNDNILSRLMDSAIEIFRTDLERNIVVSSDGTKIEVRSGE